MDDTTTGNQAINGTEADSSNNASVETTGYTDREKQYYARMKKEEQENVTLKQKLAQYENTPSGQLDKEWKERMEIKLDHGIKDEETLNFVMKNGGVKGLEDPLVKAAIQRRREDAEAQESVAFNTSPKSPIEKRFSQDEIQSMSVEELEAAIRGNKVK